MKKLFICILFICSIGINVLFAQKGENIQRNEIRLYYAMALTKMNETCSECSLFQDFFKNHPPTKPLIGNMFGVEFGRKISQTWSVVVGYRFSEKGQQSPHYYNYNGNPDFNPSANYGAASYQLLLKTNEFLFKANKQIWEEKDVFYSAIEFGFSIDVFHKSILRNFIILKDSGIKYPGCCISETMVYTKGSNLNKLLWHLQDKRFRVGLVVSNAYDIKLTKHTFLFIKPEVEILSKTLDKTFTAFTHPIWLFDLQFGLKMSF